MSYGIANLLLLLEYWNRAVNHVVVFSYVDSFGIR